MHRLHVKIFLWFWVSVVVVSATLVTLTELTYSRAEDDRHWAAKYGPRVDLWARQETRILRTEGTAALERYVSSFESDPGVLNYIFDADEQEVLGRQADPLVVGVVRSLAAAAGGTQRVDAEQRIIAEKIVDARGTPYVVVVDFPSPSILTRSLFEFLSLDQNPPASTKPRWSGSSPCSRWRAGSVSCWPVTSRTRSSVCARSPAGSPVNNCTRASTRASSTARTKSPISDAISIAWRSGSSISSRLNVCCSGTCRTRCDRRWRG
jgi:hypothetical protein